MEEVGVAGVEMNGPVVIVDGRLEFVEVKGWSKNRRDGVTRYKIAAAIFPCFAWKMVVNVDRSWVDEPA